MTELEIVKMHLRETILPRIRLIVEDNLEHKEECIELVEECKKEIDFVKGVMQI